jgi:hypothetical protein
MMMTRLIKLFFLAILLVSCTANPAVVNTPKAEPAAAQSGGQSSYPTQATADTSAKAYPAPGQSGQGSQAGPTADPKLGSVKGKLLEAGKPVANATIYLSVPVLNAQGTEAAAKFDRGSSLKATTNDKGEFTIVNVPDGKYGLVLDMVLDSYLLLNPTNGEQLRFDVSAAKQTDLGELNYDELPKAP